MKRMILLRYCVYFLMYMLMENDNLILLSYSCYPKTKIVFDWVLCIYRVDLEKEFSALSFNMHDT